MNISRYIWPKYAVFIRPRLFACTEYRLQQVGVTGNMWEKYNYREAGIIGEPYFDVDYTKVLYITDTGRAWNKTGASVRDKVEGGLELKVKNTRRLITLIGNDEFLKS